MTEPDLDPEDVIEAVNGCSYPRSVYHETSQATGTQQWVANEWATGALPPHSTTGSACKLYTSNNNFRGYQYTDGRGELEHYSTIEAVRTLNGLIISNTQCYSKGYAYCSTPKRSVCENGKESLPLSQYVRLQRKSDNHLPHWKYIEQVDRFDGEYKGHDRLIVANVDEEYVCIPASRRSVATTLLDRTEAREFARLTEEDTDT